MRCVARIPWMYAILSLEEVPDDLDWLASQGVEIEVGAWVKNPADCRSWPTTDEALAERTLGRCSNNPKHYKMFKTRDEAERAGFVPTGLIQGGLYTPTMCARFSSAIPQMKKFHEIPDDDPPGSVELALSYLRRDR